MRIGSRIPVPTPIRNSPMMPENPKSKAKPVSGPLKPGGGGVKSMPGVRMAVPATFRRGGRVQRTGVAKVHRGERIVGASGVLGKGVKAKKRMKAAKKEIKRAAKG